MKTQRGRAKKEELRTPEVKRLELLEFLGGRCSCQGLACWHDGVCGVDDLRCLQIDHINGGGTQDKKKHGSNSVMISYYLEHLADAVAGLQVLCANCNWTKRDQNGETRKKGVFNAKQT